LKGFLLDEKPSLLIFSLCALLFLLLELGLLNLTRGFFGLAVVFFESMDDGVVLDDDALSVEN